MQDDEVLAEFRASKALLEGHFLLSSGRHSAHYLQCARVLMHPERAARLALALAHALPRELRKQIDKVVSPAMGGVVVGYELARQLGVPSLFTAIVWNVPQPTAAQLPPICAGLVRLLVVPSPNWP